MTVEAGVSLVGTHCSGTARLFCEGMDIAFLGWAFNAGDIIDRIQADEHAPSSPIYPTNPAFVSVTISNFSLNSEVHRVYYFFSVLTVDLIELGKQHIKNITCGDLKDNDTQKVDVDNYFTPNVTATYQSGNLSKVEVLLVSLLLTAFINSTYTIPLQHSLCPSFTYNITLIENDTLRTRSCVGTSCITVFDEFSENNSLYDLVIVATNYSNTLKEFRLTIGK